MKKSLKTFLLLLRTSRYTIFKIRCLRTQPSVLTCRTSTAWLSYTAFYNPTTKNGGSDNPHTGAPVETSWMWSGCWYKKQRSLGTGSCTTGVRNHRLVAALGDRRNSWSGTDACAPGTWRIPWTRYPETVTALRNRQYLPGAYTWCLVIFLEHRYHACGIVR